MMKVLVLLALVGCAAGSSWSEQLDQQNGAGYSKLLTQKLSPVVFPPSGLGTPQTPEEIAFTVSAFTTACPGRSMRQCGDLCPSSPSAVFTVCMEMCGVRCGAGGGGGGSGTGGTGGGSGTGGNGGGSGTGGNGGGSGTGAGSGDSGNTGGNGNGGTGGGGTGGGGTGGGGTGGGPHGSGNGGAWPANGGGSLAKCVVNTPAKASNGAECKDLPDSEFKAFWHTLKDTHWLAFKHEKTCEHAMFQGECSDLHIRNACCKSCTADDGSICVDKEASDVSRALGLSGVSCGTLAAAGRCNHADVRKHCCAMCRMYCVNPTCKDVTEQELRHEVGKGEGGCPHAAAQDKCTHSSLYHKRCCASCILHAD